MSPLAKIIILILYGFDILFCTPTYTKKKYDHSTRTNKLVWKGIAIGIPLLILVYGIICAVFSHMVVDFGDAMVYDDGTVGSYAYLLAAGMLVCAFADIILEIKFIRGGVLFLLGHLIYVFAVLTYLGHITTVTVVIYLVFAAAGTIATVDKLDSKYRIPLIGYNLVISGSFALGVTLMVTQTLPNMLLGLGMCFLVVSDWLLARNKMIGSNFKRSLVSLLFYFGGQTLISTIIFFI